MKKLLDGLIGGFLKAIVVVFSWVPLSVLQKLSRLFAFLLENVVAYRKAIIKENLAKSFVTKNTQGLKQITTAYYQHLSDLIFETLKGFTLPKSLLHQQFHYDNPEIFTPYLEQGRSCILVGSHYNNWELGCLSFPLWVKVPVFTVYKPLSNTSINKYVNQLRGKWGMNMVAMRQLGRTIIEQKERPSLFIFVADQSPASLDHAIWADFLKRPTPFIHGFEKVGRKTNYPVFYFSIKKRARSQYKVTFHLLTTNPKELKQHELTRQYASLLEKDIQENPAHWLWSHRRWKRVKSAKTN